MLQCEIWRTNPIPKNPLPIPPTCITWMQHESAINQRDRHVNILIKIAKHVRCVNQDFWIVRRVSKCLPSKIDTVQAVLFAILCPAVKIKPIVIVSNLNKGGSINVDHDLSLSRAARRSA